MSCTLQDVLNRIPNRQPDPIPAPPYFPEQSNTERVGLAVLSMQNHTTNEGFQLFQALEYSGDYWLIGNGLPVGYTNIKDVFADSRFNPHRIQTVVMQDKREWDAQPGDFRDPADRFLEVFRLRDYVGIFKLTVLKDAHQRPHYHRQSAAEIDCHAWIVYYHPKIVCQMAPYVRPEHVIRTYHTVNRSCVPHWNTDSEKQRDGCILSGAVSGAYPLRKKLFDNHHKLPKTTVLHHPGYHRKGTHSNQYMSILSKHKVSICTTSVYGYALRKIIESVCCGCIVVTDLPKEDVLPEIDESLVRISSNNSVDEIASIVADQMKRYDPERQKEVVRRALNYYDYRDMGARLASDIEAMRLSYMETQP